MTSPTTGPSIRAFGTLAEAEALIAEARALGIRTIVDVVPNHVSDRHRLVPGGARRRARLAGARALLVPPGRGPNGDEMPTDWHVQLLGARPGPGRPTADGTPGEWYLHLFSPEQPDLNWDHPDVRRGARGHPRASGSTAASPASASTRPPCWSRTRPAGGPGRAAAPGDTRTRTATSSTTSIGAGAPIADGTPDARPGRRDLAARRRALRQVPPARTSSTRPSTSISCAGRGRSLASRSTPRSRRTPRSALRRPGSSPTTT